MADSTLHIKDTYFFEVPKWMWHHHWKSISEIPSWVRAEHPEVKNPELFNRAMEGKVLIPQWFGTPRTLYQPGTGFAISKYMLLELVVAIIMAVLFIRLASRARGGDRPRGTIWNMLEAMLVYLRDEVVRPSIGEHDADRFTPLLWTLFFFITGCNLMGLVPWAGSPTAAFAVTLTLAAIVLATGIVTGIAKLGPIGWIAHFVPHMDVSLPLKMVLFLPILALEVLGSLIRHAVLGIRLLANMIAGHLVLFAILGISVAAANGAIGSWAGVTVIAVIGSVLLSMLELFVAFLQAYVFVFLSALFLGASIHRH